MAAVMSKTQRETLYDRAYQYASGRKDAQPDKFKNMDPDMFAITAQNSYARWRETGTTAKWQGVEKTFSQYANSFA